MSFVDSHLHLDSRDVDELMGFAEATGTMLFACGIDRKTSEQVLSLRTKHPKTVRPFVGVHPSEALKGRDLRWFGPSLDKAAGAGEIGLDPTYSPTGERSAQREVLRRQLEVAQNRGKPVQVHSRNAEQECLEVLGTFNLGNVLMHWLEDEAALAHASERGYYVSFSPALLYSGRLQRMARRSDPDLVLAESDSPVSYGPLGGVHGPSLVPSVIYKLSELWGKPFDDTLAATASNAVRFIGSAGKG
ncbi:MAG: TatD family hydrolase [Thaumarchaeota archaeon]|nr:TatD family hydrolase [Nitrososphaerota archaeon]